MTLATSGSAAANDLPGAIPVSCQLPLGELITVAISSGVASAGDLLTVSAPFGVRQQDGSPVDVTIGEVDLWWDLDQTQWWTALSGDPVSVSGQPAQRVASLTTAGDCGFTGSFLVPQVDPGTYDVVPIAFNTATGSSFAYFPTPVTVQ